eukprot:806125-Amphidinium_carterae.1
MAQWLSINSIIETYFSGNSLLFRMLLKADTMSEKMLIMRDTLMPKATNTLVTRPISLKLFITWRKKVKSPGFGGFPPEEPEVYAYVKTLGLCGSPHSRGA